MKKITPLLIALCALFTSPAINAQEVTYVEDPAQGILINPATSNWFLQLQAGAGVLMSDYDTQLGFGKRITPTFNLMAGKWFTPGFGFRIGIDAERLKGYTNGGKYIDPDGDGHVQSYWQVGPAADVLFNLTNWWCGYKQGRVYNAIFTLGFAAHPVLAEDKSGTEYKGTVFGTRMGLLNTFAISKQMDFTLELRYDLNQSSIDNHHFDHYAAILAGFTYKFKKREWNAPIVAVCPEYKYTDAEGDALVARLQAADAKIASLESQLRDCLNRPQPKVEECEKAPVATIYFPINSANLNSSNRTVVKAVANALSQTDEQVKVTGWADNYTGSAKWNQILREKRAKAVVKVLKRNGVAEDRIEVSTNENNLTTYGAKSASMDRAVTIEVK